jgi:uncharacterized tellurite resistance protein B-like protein
MLKLLQDFFAELTGEGKPQDRFADNDYRLAAAALLIHVTAVDGKVTEAEQGTLFRLLKNTFNLDDDSTRELIDAATLRDRDAVDMYTFTSLLNRALDEDGRRRIVAMMWEIIYADGKVNEFEDNVVWRVADLLGISSRDRIELRRQVAAQHDSGGQDGEGAGSQ